MHEFLQLSIVFRESLVLICLIEQDVRHAELLHVLVVAHLDETLHAGEVNILGGEYLVGHVHWICNFGGCVLSQGPGVVSQVDFLLVHDVEEHALKRTRVELYRHHIVHKILRTGVTAIILDGVVMLEITVLGLHQRFCVARTDDGVFVEILDFVHEITLRLGLRCKHSLLFWRWHKPFGVDALVFPNFSHIFS